MPGNIIPESQILISSISWKIRLENFFKKNWYFVVVAFIILLPILIILSNKNNTKTVNTLPSPAPSPVANSTNTLTVICPIIKDFCSTGVDILKNGRYIGFGSKDVTKGTSLLASFEGQIIKSKLFTPTGEEIWKIYLVNTSANKKASYLFKSNQTPTKTGFVKTGEVIATISGQPMNYYDDHMFIFALSNQDSAEPIKISNKDFE